jgi:hypothetical protein
VPGVGAGRPRPPGIRAVRSPTRRRRLRPRIRPLGRRLLGRRAHGLRAHGRRPHGQRPCHGLGPQPPRSRAEHRRECRGGPPCRAPVARRAEGQHQQSRQGDTGPDPAERPPRQMRRMLSETAEQGTRGDDEDQRAEHPRAQPEQQPHRGAVCQRHGGERGDQRRQCAAQRGPGAHQPRQERPGEGADQVAHVVGGGQTRARAGGQSGLGVHQRQDRCVDEAADTHSGRERRPGPEDVRPRGVRGPPGRARGAGARGCRGDVRGGVLLPFHGPSVEDRPRRAPGPVSSVLGGPASHRQSSLVTW